MTTATQTPPTNTRTGRVKRVVEPEQVAHLWAHQSQDEARSKGRSNFYFTGDTIYSYGGHFPIARHVQNKRREKAVLFTTRGYSVTTRKHLSYTQQALRGLPVQIFHVTNPNSCYDAGTALARQVLQEYVVRFTMKLEEAAKSRKYTESLLANARGIAKEAAAFARFFGVKFTPKQFREPANVREYFKHKQAAQEKLMAQAKAKQAKQEAEYLAAVEGALPQWLNHQDTTRPSPAGPEFVPLDFRPNWNVLGRAYFRPCGDKRDEIASTLGARFPAAHAQKAYRLLRAIRARGESYHANGHTIHVGAFQVDSYDHATGVIKAGCHVIDWSEVERLAAKMGW